MQHTEMASVQFERTGKDHFLRYGSRFGKISNGTLRQPLVAPPIYQRNQRPYTRPCLSIEYGTVWIRPLPEYQITDPLTTWICFQEHSSLARRDDYVERTFLRMEISGAQYLKFRSNKTDSKSSRSATSWICCSRWRRPRSY